MISLRMSLILFFIFFTITGEAGKKKKQKIIVHVPYKIHKHLHTHTNYKVIKVPEKKENTVIFLKHEEPKKPEFNYVSIPEYQELSSLSEIKHSPTNFFSGSHPIAEASFVKGVIASTKVPFVEDNAAHQSNSKYRSFLLKSMLSNGYLVKEPTSLPSIKPQKAYNTLNNNFKISNLKAQGSTNQIFLTKGKINNLKHVKDFDNESDENKEYEHVGYLVIDGSSRKIVDKNFQNTMSSWR